MSNDTQPRQPAGSPASNGGQFAGTVHAETDTHLSPEQTPPEFDLQRIADENGWSAGTVISLAREFLARTGPETLDGFMAFAHRRVAERQALVNVPPELPVYVFENTGDGYDATQTRDEIHDGDVLAVPSEGVYGFLYEAWPVAVVGGPGEFHTPDLVGLLADRPEYTAAVAQARRMAVAAGATDEWFGDTDGPEADRDSLNGSTLFGDTGDPEADRDILNGSTLYGD